MNRSAITLALPLACFLIACTSESPSSPQTEGSSTQGPGVGRSRTASLDNRPAVVRSARLMPSPLVSSGTISLAVEAEDPEGGAVTLRRQWYLNGEAIEGQTAPTLSTELVRRGDRVSAEVTPLDAKGAGIPYRTEEVPVENSPPKVTRIAFEPFPVRVGGSVTAQAEGQDADGDEISFDFRWFHNGEEILDADQNTVSTAEFVRGDELVLEVTPSDGTDTGEMMRSEPVVVDNSPPEIMSTPPREIGGGFYSYTVKASDGDGDELTYSLETGPPGMSIDPKSGLLRWTITPDTAGRHQVRVAVTDGHVSEPTVQEFSVALGDQAAAP